MAHFMPSLSVRASGVCDETDAQGDRLIELAGIELFSDDTVIVRS